MLNYRLDQLTVTGMRLNHLHIKTTDLAATRDFYKRYFGFVEAFDHDGGAFLMDEGGFLLAIFQYKPAEPRFVFPEWYHHGFCLREEAHVRDLYSRMRKDGVEFARQLKAYNDGTVVFYALDPAGCRVEVSWNPDEARILERSPVAGNRELASVR